jgi:hypothetical protein
VKDDKLFANDPQKYTNCNQPDLILEIGNGNTDS